RRSHCDRAPRLQDSAIVIVAAEPRQMAGQQFGTAGPGVVPEGVEIQNTQRHHALVENKTFNLFGMADKPFITAEIDILAGAPCLVTAQIGTTPRMANHAV